MTHRYFVPDLPNDGGIIELPEQEAAHANRVMRVKQGDELVLFDGQNRQAIASVVAQTKRDCQCQLAAPQIVDREPHVDLTIGVALPRGDRSKALIERLTEIGVRTIVPLHAERSQGKAKPNLSTRLTRVAIEACKQCGRNQLPAIPDIQTSESFFREPSCAPRFIAHPTGVARDTNQHLANSETAFRIAIGPEGGFTDREVQMAVESGFTSIDLGPRIYRIETAAIVIAARLIHAHS